MLDSSEDARAKFKKSIEDWAQNELQSNPGNGVEINSAKDLILSCYNESKSRLNLSFKGLTYLPSAIGELTNLEELNLAYNKLTELPERIGELTNLQTLDVPENQLVSLPEGIGQLTILEFLYVRENQLTSLPERIGELTNLQTLDVSENQLASLPERIGQLTNLERFNVSHNQLISLPEGIGELTNLQTLDVTHNQLTSLPERIVELTNLRTINAFINELAIVNIPEGVDAEFDEDVVIIKGKSQVNPFLQILTDAGISAEEHQEQQNYFIDSDSNINQAFKRFIAQSASYRESTDLEKKQLAQDLFDIYKNIYQKKDDKEFMDSLNVLCEDSLADCADRNSLVMIEIDNYAKRKSSTQFEELEPIKKYEYLKSQALFGYFKELGEERVTTIKKENAEFSEDVEVILNYLRIFNEKFHGKLDLTVAKIFKQKYYEEKKYQPTEKEINDFSKIVNDKTALNEIIAGKIAKDFEGNGVYSKIFTQDELADINKTKEALQDKQVKKLEEANEGSSLDMKNQAQEITKEFYALNQKALTKVISNKLETLQAPSPNVASVGKPPSKRLRTSEGKEQV
jgi:hypothetical protein